MFSPSPFQERAGVRFAKKTEFDILINMKEEITNIELLEAINNGFTRVEERLSRVEDTTMATKVDLEQVKTNLRDFKLETRENFDKTNGKIDDLTQVVMDNHDKRIETLETKVFGVPLVV